jgi:hypothetical protein
MKPRTRQGQVAGLTKAIKSGDPRRVEYECRRAVQFDWASHWPDDWSRWVRALEDALGLGHPTVDEIFWSHCP